MAEPNAVSPELFQQRDLLISCRNSQGIDVRSTPVRITRYTAVLEVYNPHSILQLSEVLGDFRIMLGERCVYAGRGVVSNLVNAGVLVLAEVTLDDESWLDVDIFSPVAQPERLREEFDAFMVHWSRMQRIGSDFKLAVADFQMLLAEVRRWLDQVELGVRSEPTGNRAEIEREVLLGLEGRILPAIDEWAGRFDAAAEKADENLRPAYRAYARRQLHPLVMCSPFVYRTYHKPLGYAGDYEMVNMILRDPHEGATLYAKMVNVVFLRNPPAEAHRNRIKYLLKRLTEETRRVAGEGRRARILNLGCGPAREVQLFIEQEELSNQADITLLDFNDETLEYTGGILRELKERHQREIGLTIEQKSINQLLKEAIRADLGADRLGGYDFIYCAGLFDYVSDRVCRRLVELFYSMLAPGGTVLVTNVDAAKPFRYSMDYILEWHLICRNRQQMAALVPDLEPPPPWHLTADPTQVNLFLEVHRPGGRSGPPWLAEKGRVELEAPATIAS
ncbi:MAG: class I SAM-dependent methyltransferase [Verrucomicrobia bacterium]|nr:MAG: class I SAM-dependent methyltransferase [Verrucomicrobiota bacterium]